MDVFAEWTFEGAFEYEQGAPGTEPVINSACMIVHERVGVFVKMSGTAG